MFQLKRKRQRFTDKVHPIQGVISFSSAVVLILSYMGLCIYASKNQGNLAIGFVGMLIFFASIVGIILAVIGVRRENIWYRFPISGIILNGLVFMISIAFYITGIIIKGV